MPIRRRASAFSVILILMLLGLAVTSAGARQARPSFDILQNYPTPAGTTCGLDGSGRPGSEKAASNRLKNRYRLPPNGFTPLLLSDLFTLPAGTPNAPTTSRDPNNQRAVTVVGYVRDVKPGGTMGESCNCQANGTTQVDTHIELVLDPNSHDPSGKGMSWRLTRVSSRRPMPCGDRTSMAHASRTTRRGGAVWRVDGKQHSRSASRRINARR